MKHISLFSGIGGFDLASEWMGWENIAHCEWNPFGQTILKYLWPKAISYEDITKTDFTIHRGNIDILTGGFPCQPFSSAGNRKGKDDDRYLWPEMLRVINEVKPTWVVGENVAGLISMVQPETIETYMESQTDLLEEGNQEIITEHQEYVIETICRDLEQIGYEVQPIVIPACATGAPHRRDRIWFTAFRNTSTDSNGSTNERAAREYESESRSKRLPERNEVQQLDKPDNAFWDSWNTDGKRKNQVKEIHRKKQISKSKRNSQYDASDTESKSGRRELQQQSQKREFGGCDSFNWFAANSDCDERCERRLYSKEPTEAERYAGTCDACCFKSRSWENFPTQSPVCNGDDGFSTELLRQRIREDSLGFISEKEIDKIFSAAYTQWKNESIKAGGNAIVPQVAYQIFKAIQQYENSLI